MNAYEIFLKTAELGNITRTAKILNYTQSGISQAINSLEKEFGFKLFVRSKAGVRLTRKGELILPEIQNLVKQQNKLNQCANDINNIVKGTIRIAAFPSIITEVLIDIITAFQTVHENVDFEILDGPYEQICDELNSGMADIGFLPESYTEKYSRTYIYRDEVLAMIPPEHELCIKNTIEIRDLLDYPFISQFRDCELYLGEIADNILPEYTFYDDRVTVKMVSNGFGVGIITDLMIKYIDIPVVTRSFTPRIFRNIYMVIPETDNTTNLIKVFIDFVAAYVSK